MVKVKRTVLFGSENQAIIKVLGITCNFQKIDGRLICNKSKEGARVYDPNQLRLSEDVFKQVVCQALGIMADHQTTRERRELRAELQSQTPYLWPNL